MSKIGELALLLAETVAEKKSIYAGVPSRDMVARTVPKNHAPDRRLRTGGTGNHDQGVMTQKKNNIFNYLVEYFWY